MKKFLISFREVKDNEKVSLLVMITDKKLHTTKNGKTMCFTLFEDVSGHIEGIVFDDVYSSSISLLSGDEKILSVQGTVSYSGNAEEPCKIIVNKIESAEDIKPTEFKTLFINVRSDEKAKISSVISVLIGNSGKENVRLCFSDTRKVTVINEVENVNITKEILSKLVKICGKSNIILK